MFAGGPTLFPALMSVDMHRSCVDLSVVACGGSLSDASTAGVVTRYGLHPGNSGMPPFRSLGASVWVVPSFPFSFGPLFSLLWSVH